MNQKLVVHSYPRHACREGSSVWWMKDLLLSQPYPVAFPSFPCLWLWQPFGSVGKNLHWDCARLCKTVSWTPVMCSALVRSLFLTRELEEMLVKGLKLESWGGELEGLTQFLSGDPADTKSCMKTLRHHLLIKFYIWICVVGARTAVSPLGGSAWDWWITLHQRMPGLSV